MRLGHGCCSLCHSSPFSLNKGEWAFDQINLCHGLANPSMGRNSNAPQAQIILEIMVTSAWLERENYFSRSFLLFILFSQIFSSLSQFNRDLCWYSCPSLWFCSFYASSSLPLYLCQSVSLSLAGDHIFLMTIQSWCLVTPALQWRSERVKDPLLSDTGCHEVLTTAFRY